MRKYLRMFVRRARVSISLNNVTYDVPRIISIWKNGFMESLMNLRPVPVRTRSPLRRLFFYLSNTKYIGINVTTLLE